MSTTPNPSMLNWCNMCGITLPEARLYCSNCQDVFDLRQTPQPQSLAEIQEAPAHQLPELLYAAGIAPPYVGMLSAADGNFFYFDSGPRWQPERNLQHCAYLIKRYRMTIRRSSTGKDIWIVHPEDKLSGWGTKFATLAETICRVALICAPRHASYGML